MNPGSIAYRLAFEISPIILVGGIIPGGAIPIVALTQAVDFLAGLLGGSINPDLDDYFAHFQPMPGSTLVDNQIGTYPFANQAVAANAIIAQPLTISMLMKCPARGEGGYAVKLATMLALQGALAQHNSSGGTYTVVTPAAFYPNLILTRMADVSDQSSKQPQNAYQLDFVKPLLTLSDAQSVQSSLMAKLTNGTQISGQPAWSNPANTVGAPNSIAGLSVIPSASNLPGAGTSPFIPAGGTT